MLSELPTYTEMLKPGLAILCLVVFWTWETIFPLVANRKKRCRHAGRNILIALLNTIVLGILFATATVGVAIWTEEKQWGLLHAFDGNWPGRLIPAILLLDGWLYFWHRLNHKIPLLWRFHRMHHSDPQMDVTTATRFHLGEQVASATLRLGLIPMLGVTTGEIVVYEMLVVTATMFHHANISLGWCDRFVRWLIVTPRMHQVHHSRWQPETDSNYSVLFSFWDRLARTYRMRENSEVIELGLSEFDEDSWQTVTGMLKTPFVTPEKKTESIKSDEI